MKVLGLWRHPVKSMLGEALDEAEFNEGGVVGDRVWGVRDLSTDLILTARREPRLLTASARLTEGGEPHITLPDGQAVVGLGPSTDAALTDWLGKKVALVAAADEPPREAEVFSDATDDSSPVATWTMPPGRFVDLFPLLVLTTASLRAAEAAYPGGAWDVRRFRPNVLLDVDGEDWVEDGWVGSTLCVGDVEIQPTSAAFRCTIITRPQPGLARDLDIFKTLNKVHNACIGVWAMVSTPGTATVTTPATIL